jgi:hypothetical protein
VNAPAQTQVLAVQGRDQGVRVTLLGVAPP